MQVTEISRKTKTSGEVIAEFETGKILVRLINTYKNERTLEEMLYAIVCRKLTEKAV